MTHANSSQMLVSHERLTLSVYQNSSLSSNNHSYHPVQSPHEEITQIDYMHCINALWRVLEFTLLRLDHRDRHTSDPLYPCTLIWLLCPEVPPSGMVSWGLVQPCSVACFPEQGDRHVRRSVRLTRPSLAYGTIDLT